MSEKEKKERIIPVREKDLGKLRKKVKMGKEFDERISQLELKEKELKDKYLRVVAEFDNYRKRTEKEKKDIFQYGVENFILQLLPFDDIFESVLKQLETTSSSEAIHQGLEMLRKEFTNLLNSLGVKKIESVGKSFDPVIHEASEVVKTTKFHEGKIIEQERAGYFLHDKVLRPALVKVAKHPEKKGKSSDNESQQSGKN